MRRLHVVVTLAIVVAGVGTGCRSSGTPMKSGGDGAAAAVSPASRAKAADDVDRIMQDATNHPDHVGMSVAVFRGWEPVLVKGYGLADAAGGKPVTEHTRFRIGSVSKQYTAALVLLLAEDGKLSLDDRVSVYLPDLGHAGEITIRRLLQHTSGYRDFYPFDFPQAEAVEPLTQRQLADRMAALPLDFPPGTHYSYSNTGYLVAGLIVEKVTGKPFGRVLHERILGPLELSETAAIGYDATGATDATGYERGGLGPMEPAALEHPDCLIGCGGVVATPRDVAKWQLALMDGKLLSPASLKEMTTPPTMADGSLSGYGLGLVIASRSGRPSWAHGGATSGFLTEELGVPAERMSVVLCCNSARSDTGAIMGKVMQAMLPTSSVTPPAVAGPPAAEVARKWIEGLIAGKPDRSMVSADFNRYFTQRRVEDNARALAALGAIKDVRTTSTGERGGTEYTSTHVDFEKGAVSVGMYRRPDGVVEQILIYRE
jgi:D-alanyl-D-alanine carboxypeptidase